jgi:predicted aspartyl protease
VTVVKAKIRLKGTRDGYSSMALVDTGARMSLIDKSIADLAGVELTGREIDFVSVSGHMLRASEAVLREFEIEGESLKYEVVAVAEIPEAVKEALMRSGLDGRVIVGLLTLERANMLPDTATGQLKRAGSFIL